MSTVPTLGDRAPSTATGWVGAGVRLVDPNGLEYLDAASGTFNLPLGYDHPQVVDAVREQLGRACHISSHLVGAEAEAVQELLLRHAPEGMSAAWMRDVTGSTAVECAIRIAQKATGKTDVVSLFGAHHGQTSLATAVSGNSFRRKHQPASLSPYSIKVPRPACSDCFYGQQFPACSLLCATRIQDFLDEASSGRVAAILVEPVQGNGGNLVPPPGYFEEVRRICDRNGALLIVDEVQTGVGRTGFMYACETFDIRPDVMVLAKGLGGIGVPVGAVLMRSRLSVLEAHEHSFTSGGNLLSLAAARATLEVIGGPGFLPKVRSRSTILERLLRDIEATCATVTGVRGVGYMWGLDVSSPDSRSSADFARCVAEIAFRRYQLILRTSRYGRGNTIKVRPALVTDEEDLVEIANRLAAAILDAECGRGG